MIERTLTDGAYIVGEVELRAACVAMDCILDVRSDLWVRMVITCD